MNSDFKSNLLFFQVLTAQEKEDSVPSLTLLAAVDLAFSAARALVAARRVMLEAEAVGWDAKPLLMAKFLHNYLNPTSFNKILLQFLILALGFYADKK